MARVWVTRAQPGADATATRLRALGHQPLVAPLIEVRPTGEPAPDLDGVGALAFSSANGVATFVALTPERGRLVYAVGRATAEAARKAGFTELRAGEGDILALARLIIADRARPPGVIVHICPSDPAGDLVGELGAAGVSAQRANLYETVAVDAAPPAVGIQLGAGALDVVLIHSPKASRTLVRLAKDDSRLFALKAVCLSEACAAPLRAAGFPSPQAAPFPQEEALLSLVPR